MNPSFVFGEYGHKCGSRGGRADARIVGGCPSIYGVKTRYNKGIIFQEQGINRYESGNLQCERTNGQLITRHRRLFFFFFFFGGGGKGEDHILNIMVYLSLFVRLLELRPWSVPLANNEKPPDSQSRELPCPKTRFGEAGVVVFDQSCAQRHPQRMCPFHQAQVYTTAV